MLWVCIIRPSSAALSGSWPMARWRHSMIARDRARSRRSPPRPRHGWGGWPAGRRRDRAIRTSCGRRAARHAREHGPAEGHGCLAKLVQGTVCKILNEQEVKPHKVRYYLERRDPEFKAKM